MPSVSSLFGLKHGEVFCVASGSQTLWVPAPLVLPLYSLLFSYNQGIIFATYDIHGNGTYGVFVRREFKEMIKQYYNTAVDSGVVFFWDFRRWILLTANEMCL